MEKVRLSQSKFALILIGIWLCSFYCYAKAEGANWKYMGVNEDGRFYYDTQSISYPSRGIGRVWVQFFVTQESKNNLITRLKESGFHDKAKKLGNLDSIRILHEVDCSNQLFRNMQQSYYDKKGNILEIINTPGKTQRLLISGQPSTPLEAVFKVICP